MGTSNILQPIEVKLAKLKGKLEEKREQIKTIEEGVTALPTLYAEVSALEARIAAGIAFMQPDHPDWKPEKIRPMKEGKWDSPFPNGEMGRRAIDVLRENGGWMKVSDVSKAMLANIDIDEPDRYTVEKTSNSVLNYLKKHSGDLVESDNLRPVRYRIMPDSYDDLSDLSEETILEIGGKPSASAVR